MKWKIKDSDTMPERLDAIGNRVNVILAICLMTCALFVFSEEIINWFQ